MSQSFKVLEKVVSFHPAKVTQYFASLSTDALILSKLRLLCTILLEITVKIIIKKKLKKLSTGMSVATLSLVPSAR